MRLGLRETCLIAAATAAILLALPGDSRAQDWNQWRGPGRDGALTRFKVPTPLPEKLNQVWKVEVGEGHSSPLVVGELVYVFFRQGEEEIARCLSLADGRQIWSESYTAPYTVNPVAAAHGKGPKSTPVLAEGRLYTLGIGGILTCREAKTGKQLWQKRFAGEYKETAPSVGTAMSPIFTEGVLIAHIGGKDDGAITAFAAKTGEERWRWKGDGPSYSSPILLTVDGVRQIVAQTQKLCVGLEAATGKLLWSIPFTTAYDQNAVTPVAIGNMVVFAGLRKPTVALRLRKDGGAWKADKVWETDEVTMYMSTAVASGNRLYGMSERRRGQMFALDAATGKTLWLDEGRAGENASIWDAGKFVLAVSTDSDLVFYQKGDGAEPGLKEVKRYKIADSQVWASPAFLGDRILVKDSGSLTLWRLTAP